MREEETKSKNQNESKIVNNNNLPLLKNNNFEGKLVKFSNEKIPIDRFLKIRPCNMLSTTNSLQK